MTDFVAEVAGMMEDELGNNFESTTEWAEWPDVPMECPKEDGFPEGRLLACEKKAIKQLGCIRDICNAFRKVYMRPPSSANDASLGMLRKMAKGHTDNILQFMHTELPSNFVHRYRPAVMEYATKMQEAVNDTIMRSVPVNEQAIAIKADWTKPVGKNGVQSAKSIEAGDMFIMSMSYYSTRGMLAIRTIEEIHNTRVVVNIDGEPQSFVMRESAKRRNYFESV